MQIFNRPIRGGMMKVKMFTQKWDKEIEVIEDKEYFNGCVDVVKMGYEQVVKLTGVDGKVYSISPKEISVIEVE